MKKAKDLLLDNGYENILVFSNPSYDSALIGVSDDNRAVYDFNLMVEFLMEIDHMDETDAIEFIEYNSIRALPYYEIHPIVVYPFPDR